MKKPRETQLQRTMAKDLVRLFLLPNQMVEVEDLIKECQAQSHKEANDVTAYFTGLEEQIHEMGLRMGTMDAALEKLSTLTDDYYRAMIVTPVMQRLISLYDICNQLARGDIAVMSAMKVFKEQILEELERFGVVPITIECGQEFNPSFCKPRGIVPAENEDEHNTIFGITQVGFYFVNDKRVVRPAQVVVKQVENKEPKGE